VESLILHVILQKNQLNLMGLVHAEDKKTVLCAVPVNILAPKLTMKCIKDLATLHQIFIPSKTLVKNAQMLLQDHKCNKCDNYISLFEPYKVQSNSQWQQNWYKKLEHGMITGSSCENEGHFDKLSSRNLLKCKGKNLILVVHARV
jgi:hypothetical protein